MKWIVSACRLLGSLRGLCYNSGDGGDISSHSLNQRWSPERKTLRFVVSAGLFAAFSSGFATVSFIKEHKLLARWFVKDLLTMRRYVFPGLAVLLVGAAVLRSAVTTRLDGFTIDEAYHVAAGVSYVKDRDFRINPEQPPLVKLWVGTVVAATGFHLDPLRRFSDKPGERHFANLTIFQENDPESVQRRARAAMFALNSILLLALAFALRHVFDRCVALSALLFLAIDPTVAAHLPVVMMDLPVALLSTTGVVLAAKAFRGWAWRKLRRAPHFSG